MCHKRLLSYTNLRALAPCFKFCVLASVSRASHLKFERLFQCRSTRVNSCATSDYFALVSTRVSPGFLESACFSLLLEVLWLFSRRVARVSPCVTSVFHLHFLRTFPTLWPFTNFSVPSCALRLFHFAWHSWMLYYFFHANPFCLVSRWPETRGYGGTAAFLGKEFSHAQCKIPT